MDIRKTLLIIIAFVIIAAVQALPIKEEIENPEEINNGAKTFDQHNLRQLSPRSQDSDCLTRWSDKCKSDADCCGAMECTEYYQCNTVKPKGD